MPTKTPSEIEKLTAEVERLKSDLIELGTDLTRTKLTLFAVACANAPGAFKAYELCGLTEQQLRDRLAPLQEYLQGWEISAVERGLQAGRLVFGDISPTSKFDPDGFSWVLACRKRGLWVPF